MPEVSSETDSTQKKGGAQDNPDITGRREIIGALAKGIVASTVITGVSSSAVLAPLDPHKKELNPLNSQIRFEPGDHDAIFRKGYTPQEIDRLFNSGITSRWNSEVLNRLREYSPKVLTIDGLHAGVKLDYRGGKKQTLDSKVDERWLRSFLPGDPSKINENGKVFVVVGDQFAGNGMDGSGLIHLKDQDYQNLRTEIENMIKSDYNNYISEKDVQILLGVSSMLVAAGGVNLARAYILDREAKGLENSGNRQISSAMSRRAAVKLIGATGFMAGLGSTRSGLRRLLGNRAVDAKDAASKDQNIRQSDKLAFGIKESEWVSARNAMYVLKTRDSLSLLKAAGKITEEDKAAIIAGGFHRFGMNRLLNDDEACNKAIKVYAKRIFDIVDRLSDEGQIEDVRQVKLNIAQMIAALNIFSVTDIDLNSNSARRIEDSVKYVGGGISESVFASVKSLVSGNNHNELGISLAEN